MTRKGSTPATTTRPALLGRSGVLTGFAARLESAASGTGGLLWLSGEAGIGKTRLLSELGALAESRGFLVLRGAGWEDPSTPAFWVWTQVLREVAGPRSVQELGRAWGPGGEKALHLLSGRPDAAGGSDRFPLFDSVAGVVLALAHERPVVLLLDDLQWADLGSLRLLRFLSSAVSTRPVLLACAWRSDETAPADGLAEVAADLAAHGELLTVDGLGPDAVAELIEAMSGLKVSRAEADAVVEQTRGNPLFVSEMARLAEARGAGPVAGTVASSAQATIQRRVARLSQPCHRMLAAASVAGPEAKLDLVAHLVDQTPAQLVDVVDEAVDAGIVTQRNGRVVFAHALLRDAVYAAAPAGQRRRLHLAAGEYVGRAGRVPDARAAEVAHHLIQALPLSSMARAVQVGEQAARAAAAAQAYEEAARLYELLLDLLGTESADRPRLLLARGECLLACGDLAAARGVYLDAAAMARRTGQVQDFARAALGFAAGLGGFEVRLGDRTQTDLLEEALDLLPPRDSELRAYTLARLSVAVSLTAPTERRAALAAEAVGMARRLGLVAPLAHALAAHCDAIAGPDACERREREATEIIALARASGDLPLELLGVRLRVLASLELGDMAGAGNDMHAFAAIAETLRQPLYSWLVPLWRGFMAHLAGDLDTMTETAADVAGIGALVDSHNAAALSVVQRLWVDAERGRLQGAGAAMLEAVEDGLPELALYGGTIFALFPGRPDAVRRAALPHLAALLADLPFDAEWLPNLCLTTLSIFEGDDEPEYAEQLYAALLPYAHRFVVDGIFAGALGSLERFLGMLATMTGRYDAAEDHFERALSANASIGSPLLVANTQRVYGLMIGRRGDDRCRDQLLTAARDAYAAMGITERAAELDAMLSVDTATASIAPETGVFKRSGGGWLVTFRGRDAVLKDLKGMSDLSVLLARPDQEMHVLDLTAGPGEPRPGTERAPGREGDLGPVLDDRARAAYRAKLDELEATITDAEDASSRARAETEREFLVAELASAYGLGGRPRRAGDPAEKARSTVTRRIRDAIGRIELDHPELGRHLRASVRTGTFCSYSPEHPPSWEL